VSTIISRARGLFFVREEPKPTSTKATPKPVVKYHAVSIEPGRNCCHSARMLQGTRFLSREAPALPLKNCSNDQCTCHYAHHDDRRTRPRRARDMGVAVDGWLEKDLRVGAVRGRRKTDKPSG
jgi:hypothetical protein